MGEKWRQLKYEDRLQLDICLKGKMKVPDIAKLLHVAKTTIYREIKRGKFTKRNSDWTESEVYDPYVANEKYKENLQKRGRQLKIGNDLKYASYLEKKIIEDKYSPEAALVTAKRDTDQGFQTTICVNTLYSYIRKGIFLNLTMEDLPIRKKKQKKGLQASEAISQAEEWKNQAEKSEIQIQKLLSEKQELVSTVAEQGKRIAEQTEQIEKLNEADNVLKLNAELKKQNEKLKQDKLNAEQEAEATVSSVKREYEAKGRELDRRIGEAAKQSASLKSERQSISEDIEQRATAKYLDQKKELDRKFKAQTASYDSFLLGLLLYGVLTTVFTAVRSEAFVSDFKTFFMVIWQFIVNAFQLLLKGGQWASQLGDKIPQPVVATIVHYLLLIVFVGGIAIGVGFLIFLGASKVFEFYTEDYADTMSLAVFLISLAVSVYFAEPIRAVIPINLLLLLILVHIVYVLIRWYVKGCMRSRGYY